MKTKFIIFFLATALCGNIHIVKAQESVQTSSLTYKIFKDSVNTYGYDIYAGNKLVVHQPNIPAMPGNKGFKTKADAEKVAQLVISKIKKGEMPPTVTAAELQKLKVIP